MAEERNFLGETPDERRARRRGALIEAALNLVHRGGLPGIGVRSVASEAKLSTRYFYESFSDTDELLIAALHQVSGELLQVGRAALHVPPLKNPKRATQKEIRARFRNGLDAALGVFLDDPRKAALIVAVSASSPRVQEEMQRLVGVVAAAITDDVDAADVGFDGTSALFVAGGLVQTSKAFVAGDLKGKRADFVDDLTRLVLGAISTTGRGS